MKREVTLALVGALWAGCNTGPQAYQWSLPANFPEPIVPADNPMTVEKVALGRFLFYDKRLSGNGTMACGTCHQQSLAFTDGKATPMGSTGATLARNSMAIANVAYDNYLGWANPLLNTIEEQMLVPMFGDAPIELGMSEAVDDILGRLRGDPMYRKMFGDAYPGDNDPFNIANVVKAIGSFERTLISGTSPYDKFENGDSTAMSASAQNGLLLFNTEKYDCYHCHAGTNFTTTFVSKNTPEAARDFRNDGLYNIDGMGAYPPNNTGLYGFTQFNNDMGKFRVPTLRNIAVTAPYFHDGSAATLDDALDNYAHGGRITTTGPYAGDGSLSPHRDPLVKPIDITDQERADITAFFDALTDTDFITNPALSDPFQ